MNATWKNNWNRSASGWNVIRVLFRIKGGFGECSELGFDNTRPDETNIDTERRIAKRFNVEPIDLILEIL